MYSVLYVDDEPSLLEIGKIFLERSGRFRVTILTSAEEALTSPSLATFDAIVSDYQMPGMDGIAFLKEVREKYGDLPFIIFTGKGREDVVIDAVNSGADFYVQKGGDPGVQFADLVHKVGLAIDRRRTRDELKAAYDKLSASEEVLRQKYDELAKSGEALRESEERYRAVFENTGTATAILEEDCTISLVNSRFVELAGFAAADIEGKKSWHEFAVPEDISRMDEQHRLRRTDPKKAKNRYEFRFRTKSGEIRDILLFVGEIPGTRQSVASLLDISDRRKADDLACESEKKFILLFKNSPVALTLVSATDGKFVDVNDAFIKNTGYSVGEVIGRTATDIGIVADPAGYAELVADIRDRQNVSGREMPCRIKSGEVRICRFFSSLIMMGDRPYVLSTVDDVTDRRHAEKALEQSRERYRLMLMNAKDGIMVNEFTKKGPGKFIEINDTACRILGMTREEVRNISLIDLDMEETNQRAPGFVADIMKNRHAIFQIPYRTKTGEEKILDISVSIFDLEGHPAMFSIVRDITGQVTTERALRTSEERFRALVETSPDMIWEIDPEGKFRYISPTIGPLMGYSPEEVKGKPITFLVAEQGREIAMREFQKHVASGCQTIQPFEVSARHRDGHDMTVEIRSSRVTDREGNLTGFRGVARDITDQRKAEKALERANRQLTLLGSSTRHDALNKITAILGYLRIVSIKCSDPEAKEFLLKTEASVVSLRSLIEFTRIYQDLGSQEPLWKDLAAVIPVSQVPKSISFFSDVTGMSVYADAMLEKVFTNLLDNSVRHGEHVTVIRVFSRQEGTDLVIVWEDDGIGIPAPYKEKIFGRGYGKNTGLGLFLVREILALTGISIRETGVPGSGARFEILVPEEKYRLAGRT